LTVAWVRRVAAEAAAEVVAEAVPVQPAKTHYTTKVVVKNEAGDKIIQEVLLGEEIGVNVGLERLVRARVTGIK